MSKPAKPARSGAQPSEVHEVLRRLLGAIPSYARIAWWGLVSPRSEDAPPVVHQAVIRHEGEVLLCVRAELRGWELPGGAAHPGESEGDALRREVREETGLEVEVLRPVGDYVRTGFRPHTARVSLCRPSGGALRPSAETPSLAWFPGDALPDTLFPWYRAPLVDALAERGEPVRRTEHLGLGSIWSGLRIDLRMRIAGP